MIRTRIAPSPTGFPHLGTIYLACFNYALAKKNNGQFVLRLEDTDRKRFVQGAEEVIYKSLDWFNLSPDESPLKNGSFGPYRQSERLDLYKKYAEELIKKGNAYYCFCTQERLDTMRKIQTKNKMMPKYDRLCLKLSKSEIEKKLAENTSYVIRMKVPDNEIIAFNDLIIGEIKFNSNDIDDQVILKSDGFPTYHLAVVVDDHLMEITDIIRGREWISSTPKHILLYHFFGWDAPTFAHLPLILNSEGQGKLSKRHGHASINYYRELGFLPEVILNYLTNLVWYHPENKEIYNFDEFIKLIDLKKINSQGAKFNVQKLEWMNGEYIRNMKLETLNVKLLMFLGNKFEKHQNLIKKTIPLVQERIKKWADYYPLCQFFFERPKIKEVDLSQDKELIKNIYQELVKIEDWKANNIGEKMQDLAKKLGIKNSHFFMVLRVVITGKKISPPLNESMEILGKEECMERVNSTL